MVRNSILRQMIIDRFGGVSELAEIIGWSYSKLYRICNGCQGVNVEDIRTLKEKLCLSKDQVFDIFFN